MLRSLILASLLFCGSALGAGENIVDLLKGAEEAFERGKSVAMKEPDESRSSFRSAGELYAVATEKVDNPGAAHYNAANSFVLSGDMGEAIYHYRMAQLYHPFDSNLTHNLRSARLQIVDSIHEDPDRSLIDLIVYGVRFVAPWIRATLLAIGYMVVFLALWKLLTSGRSRIWRRTAFIAAGVALLAAVSLIVEWWVCQGGRDGVVVVEEVVARTGDGTIYPRAFTNPLHAGVEFRLKETRGDWKRVELWNGEEGWLPASAIRMVEL